MASGPTWQQSRAQVWRAPAGDRLGRWATAGIILSLFLHVLAFFVLNRIKFAMPLSPPTPLNTERMRINPVESVPIEMPDMPPAETPVERTADLNKLVDEIDILDQLPKNTEMEVRPDAKELAVHLQTGGIPLASGSPEGTTTEITPGLDLSFDLPMPGQSNTSLMSAAEGQMIVNRGVSSGDIYDPNVVDDLLKKGAGGTAPQGALQGSIEEALGLPADVLVGKTTVLPGDLLFEYDSSQLRESARVALLKLGTLIDLNPDLYCWIEGYSDLFGADEYNLSLSARRAQAVRDYLVNSLRIPPDKIVPRGYGKEHPRVLKGTVEEQAPNRRVEIKMRKTPPPPAPVPVKKAEAPPAPAPTPPPPAPASPPARRTEPSPQPQPTPPRAIEVPQQRAPVAPPKARIIEEEPPRAVPIEETPTAPRARPVEE